MAEKKQNRDIWNKPAQEEFISVIKEYLLPLIDVAGELQVISEEVYSNSVVFFEESTSNAANIIRFYPCFGSKRCSPFYCQIETFSKKEQANKLDCIFKTLLNQTEYKFYGHKAVRVKPCVVEQDVRLFKKNRLSLAFELGMCVWLAGGTTDGAMLYSILAKMIEWAGKTYEGKNVPFGLIVDFNRSADEQAANYLHFLDNDSSAVFTDGIFSGILLDKNGKVISFLTRDSALSENMPEKRDERETATEDTTQMLPFVPYFFESLSGYCQEKTVGIFVLTSGEILLVKGGCVCFAKRGSKWVSFDWEIVRSHLFPYFRKATDFTDTEIENRIRAIYCTLLDVSFSHTGGCLAVVLPEFNSRLDNVVKDRFDLTIAGNMPEGITEENQEKIEILRYLLDCKKKDWSFYHLQRLLRKEVLSLDGATVISIDGTNCYCAGSIVSVPGGSHGGGRTAAATKLAEAGIAIKISQDGYIEAYGLPLDELLKEDSNEEDEIKVITLFRIK